MKFYADDRDIIKWSVILSLADSYSIQNILYVAMMQKDGKNNQGQVRTGNQPIISGCLINVIAHITNFFKNENKYINNNKLALDDIKRIKCISSGRKIHIVKKIYDDDSYFSDVYKIIHCSNKCKRRIICFLDPCSGLLPKTKTKGKSKYDYVDRISLSYIYSLLCAGSFLIVFQFLKYKTNDMGRPDMFKEIIGNNTFSIKSGNVLMLIAWK
jgi:hypothetical protein